jgi:hypothetical protein
MIRPRRKIFGDRCSSTAHAALPVGDPRRRPSDVNPHSLETVTPSRRGRRAVLPGHKRYSRERERQTGRNGQSRGQNGTTRHDADGATGTTHEPGRTAGGPSRPDGRDGGKGPGSLRRCTENTTDRHNRQAASSPRQPRG